MRTSGSSFLQDHNFLLMQRYNRREKCCLYPPADLSRGKTFFPSKRRESNIPFIIVITPLIVFVTESHEVNFICFRVLSTSNTSTSYKSLSVLRFRSTFFIFFRGADRILPQNAVEDMTFASDDSLCLFVRANTIPLSTRCSIHCM